MMGKHNFRIRSAKVEAQGGDVPRWMKEGARDEEANKPEHTAALRRYRGARLEERARVLREFTGAGATEGVRRARRDTVDDWAREAGFSDVEVREMRHLVDGESPEGGWRLE